MARCGNVREEGERPRESQGNVRKGSAEFPALQGRAEKAPIGTETGNRKSRNCTIPALETRNFETVNWTGPPGKLRVQFYCFEISGFQCGNRAISRFPISPPTRPCSVLSQGVLILRACSRP